MKIIALAGGVGGAKLVDGLAQCLRPEDLSVIVNTGDDFEHLGLKISPDVDTVCYTLAGQANELTGWGQKNETWTVLSQIEKLGGPTWFHLGDRDIATHLERTRLLKNEKRTLSEIVNIFCEKMGIKQSIFPMCDSPVRTMIKTVEYGWLGFQEYFVKYQCQPKMVEYRFDGIENSCIPIRAKEKLSQADWVIICPSNPFVSIEPILRVNGMLELIKGKKVAAVSPIVGGKAIKGPAAKMFQELGVEPSAYEVIKKYGSLVKLFVVQKGDKNDIDGKIQTDIIIRETDTIMAGKEDRMRLAKEILGLIEDVEEEK